MEISNGKNAIASRLDSLRDIGVIQIEARSQLSNDYLRAKTPSEKRELKRIIEVTNTYGQDLDSLNLKFVEMAKYMNEIIEAQILLGDKDEHSTIQNSFGKDNINFIKEQINKAKQ